MDNLDEIHAGYERLLEHKQKLFRALLMLHGSVETCVPPFLVSNSQTLGTAQAEAKALIDELANEAMAVVDRLKDRGGQ